MSVTIAEIFTEKAREKLAELERERLGITLAEEADRLAGDLAEFVERAWVSVWPNQPYVPGWHITAICDHLARVTSGELRRLQVWVPPGSSKSTVVSIMWPAWEWAREPWRRYITASYDLGLATDFATKSRDLIKSPWFQARWPGVVMRRDQDLKQSYANTAGGARYATSPTGAGTGRHAHTIIIDDPLNAREVASESALEAVREWHAGTITTRFAEPKTGAEVIIMQRLDERDLAGHVLGLRDDWEVLCLPEEYEPAHPYAWRGDPRLEPGELLMPERVGQLEHEARARELGAHRAAGQLQQRPAAREGAILKRDAWRFFPRRWLEDDEFAHLPRFTELIQSWDTSFKDLSDSDYVVGGLWGKRGADLYLLALRRDRMGLSATKAAMRAMTADAERRWPRLPMRILIEKSANGVEIIAELKREIRGVIPVVASVKKELRAEAAEPALEGGNVWVPGAADPNSPAGYDVETTPAFTQGLIEECAVFPNGAHDDQVDMFTQAVNWTRSRKTGGSVSVPVQRVPAVGALAGIDSWDRT